MIPGDEMNDKDYSAYAWYNVITDVCWLLSCLIVSVILIMYTNHHICWPIGLMILASWLLGMKTKAQWSQ